MHNCPRWASTLFCLAALCSVASAKKNEATEVRVETKTIPAPMKYEFSRTLEGGRLRQVSAGTPGTLKRTYQVVFRNGKPVGKQLLKEERIEPEAGLTLMGRRGYASSRGSYTRSRVLTMHATAYDPSPATIGPGATGLTKMGIPAGYGVVAVDRRVIPLGTRVFVEGYGYAIAADIGSAIKGNRIDLCFEDRGTAIRFGRRQVKVHILSTR